MYKLYSMIPTLPTYLYSDLSNLASKCKIYQWDIVLLFDNNLATIMYNLATIITTLQPSCMLCNVSKYPIYDNLYMSKKYGIVYVEAIVMQHT